MLRADYRKLLHISYTVIVSSRDIILYAPKFFQTYLSGLSMISMYTTGLSLAEHLNQ